MEIFNRQIEIRREFNVGNILETSFEFETWNKYPIISRSEFSQILLTHITDVIL